MNEKYRERILKWEDLTEKEKEQAKETYLSIREHEENRLRDEITKDYPYPINSEGVKTCNFERDKDGYIIVII